MVREDGKRWLVGWLDSWEGKEERREERRRNGEFKKRKRKRRRSWERKKRRGGRMADRVGAVNHRPINLLLWLFGKLGGAWVQLETT